MWVYRFYKIYKAVYKWKNFLYNKYLMKGAVTNEC